MLNPVCACGEIMVAEAPAELLWDYPPQSVDVRRLAMLSMSNVGVWACFGCGDWVPSRRLIVAGPEHSKKAGKRRRRG